MPNPTVKENQVTTGEVRLSYVNLLEARAIDGGDPRYSCVIIIPKSDKATLTAIRKAIKFAADNGKAKFKGGKVPNNLKTTLKDGDDEDVTDLERNPEYEGCMYMNVSAKKKPGVIDRAKKPVDDDEVYSGVYARVQMGAFAYNTQGNQGVSFGLNHVQILKAGEPLGGMVSADAAFDDLDDEYDDELGDDDDMMG